MPREARRLLRTQRNVRVLLAAIAASQAASWLSGVAIVVHVFDLTRSASWVASTTALRTLPVILLATVAGAIADRYDRRMVFGASQLLGGGILAVLAVTAAATAPVLVLLALACAVAAVSTPAEPAQTALIPGFAREDDLATVNAAVSAVEHVAMFAGPAVAGVLLGLAPSWTAFACAAVLHVAAAAAVARLDRPHGQPTAAGRSLRGEIIEGARVLLAHRDVTVLTVFVVASTFVYGFQAVALVQIADLLGGGAQGVGFLMAAGGVGGLLTALVAGRLVRRRHPGAMLAGSAVLLGVPLGLLAVVGSKPAACLLMMLDGAGGVALDVLSVTLLQRVLPRAILARVFALLKAVTVAGMLLGTAAAPGMIALLGVRGAVGVAGMLMPLLALGGHRLLLRLGGPRPVPDVRLAPHLQPVG